VEIQIVANYPQFRFTFRRDLVHIRNVIINNKND